jgi:hypothetical protein
VSTVLRICCIVELLDWVQMELEWARMDVMRSSAVVRVCVYGAHNPARDRYGDPWLVWIIAAGPRSATAVWNGSQPECAIHCADDKCVSF